MHPYIKAISYYLPPDTLDNPTLEKLFPEWSASDIYTKTGITLRHIAGEGVIASDLALQAAEKLFSEHRTDPSEIDFLIFCTQSPDFAAPTTACMLQDKLGLPTTCGALDINLGCSGFLYCLSVAHGLMIAEGLQNVLILTAETLTKYIHPKDKSTRILFGDAAAAVMVSQGKEKGIHNFVFGTDGSGAEYMIRRYGGFRFPPDKVCGLDYSDQFGNIKNYQYFDMQGMKVMVFSLKIVPNLIQSVLQKNNKTFADIDLFIFHQANGFLLETLRKKLNIPEDKFFVSIEHTGNTVSSTLPIALYEAEKQGRLKRGQTVLLAAFGVGLSWAATIIRY